MSKTITLCEGYLLKICDGSFYNDTFIFSGVRVWQQQSGSIHLGIKRRKKSKRSVGSLQEHMESFKNETDSLWCTHAIPFQTAHPTLILSSRHGCTVIMNSDHPQEYKTALMPHLLKQQDHFISLDLVPNPYIKLPLRHGASREKKKGIASKMYSSWNHLLKL